MSIQSYKTCLKCRSKAYEKKDKNGKTIYFCETCQREVKLTTKVGWA